MFSRTACAKTDRRKGRYHSSEVAQPGFRRGDSLSTDLGMTREQAILGMEAQKVTLLPRPTQLQIISS